MRKLSRAEGDTGELVRAYRAEVAAIAKEFKQVPETVVVSFSFKP